MIDKLLAVSANVSSAVTDYHLTSILTAHLSDAVVYLVALTVFTAPPSSDNHIFNMEGLFRAFIQ